MKKCTKCCLEKEEIEFNKCSRSKDGLSYYCKVCNKKIRSVYIKKYAKTGKYKKKKREYQSKYLKSDKGKMSTIEYRTKYFSSPRGNYLKYKDNAEKRNYKFNLTLEQFKDYWKKDCSYCGSKIETIGLDRIDNNKGYSVENVKPCCSRCNSMKEKMVEIDFINHCKRITKFNDKQNYEQ